MLAPVERSLETAFGAPDAVPEGLSCAATTGPQYTSADCAALCTVRPHEALGWKTLSEKRAENLGTALKTAA